jgi:hypothetical protein
MDCVLWSYLIIRNTSLPPKLVDGNMHSSNAKRICVGLLSSKQTTFWHISVPKYKINLNQTINNNAPHRMSVCFQTEMYAWSRRINLHKLNGNFTVRNRITDYVIMTL